jgi:hypothetical protein
MRLLLGSCDKIVSIVLRTNCWRVILWEEDISTMWRSVFRRKMEYEIAWTTSTEVRLDISGYYTWFFHSVLGVAVIPSLCECLQ